MPGYGPAITAVRVFTDDAEKLKAYEDSVASEKTYDMAWIRNTVIANPMSRYPAYFEQRSSWLGGGGRVMVLIETDAGVTGIGESTGGVAAASIIAEHLSRFLVGRSPFQIEMLWDMMFRSTLPYGRKGLPIMAISAVDLALWDCVAKLRGEPLYVSLGGPARDFVPAYITGNDTSRTRELGFVGQKLAMPYGPASGRDGMHRNAALVREAREALGEEIDIMLDCYMAWDVDYSVRMAELLRKYKVKWIEESLPPDDYAGYAALHRKVTSTAIATGEHEYTRYGFQQLLDVDAADIYQPDVYWCGGLTEAKKICALASAKHKTVIPHAGGTQPWTLHLLFAQPDIPMAEYFLGAGEAHPFYDGIPFPKQGRFERPEAVGAGIALKEDAFDRMKEYGA
ncbi:enolase C-terminal domain-like protein [Paenibacillus sp.]|uniref:enolase C-terminal domain-like protein n=1 Tax=Paenibacillus sp. TaxID=58172 RepID=UPI002D3F60A4|nr:enolase C-terminal domain-like protein [Paenibacillus sp.]HZG56183.1 enolase C-terminal domain-like protein [Paenibacillus sp.]